MSLPDKIVHLLSFGAPALVVAFMLSLAAGWVLPGQRQAGRWWRHGAVNAIAGLGALAAGLALFGVDGKMASYGALVGAVATSQWICSRAWRG